MGLIPEIEGADNDPFAEEFLKAFMESPLVLDSNKEDELDLTDYLQDHEDTEGETIVIKEHAKFLTENGIDGDNII